MSYQFTAAEQAQIQAARLLCPVGEDTPTSWGNWVPFYTKLWLDVAIGANGSTGMHSAFIRTYTDLQGVLRRGTPFTADEMQKASNGVALNLWKNLRDPVPGPPWTLRPVKLLAVGCSGSGKSTLTNLAQLKGLYAHLWAMQLGSAGQQGQHA